MGGDQKPDYKDVQSGPLDQNNRECRDIFCCLLFLACICAMVYCTIAAYSNGDTTKMFRGVLDTQHICGQGDAKDYPYLYFTNPIDSINNRFCVKQCPKLNATSTQCYRIATPPSCTFSDFVGGDGAFNSTTTIITLKGHPQKILGYQSTEAIGRVCIPSLKALTGALTTVVDSISTNLENGQFATFVQDVQNNWKWLLAGVAFSIVVSIAYMLILRCLVGLIVWVSVFGSILAIVGLGVIFLYNSGVSPALNDRIGFIGLPTLQGSQYYATYAYICFGIAGFLLVLLICCCSRIRLAVAVCKVAGQFVARVCQTTLVPIILTVILVGMWAACLVCMVYLLSCSDFTAYPGDIFTSVTSYSDSSLFRLYFFIFGTFWCNAFIQALGIFIIASSCCMWYYNHGANSQLDSPVTRSTRMAFRYHFGSLAFGAFLLALVQFIQMMVQLFKKHAESTGVAQQNKCFEYAVGCLQCCLKCLERIIQFINQTAYIQIALRGKNFCMAAKDGFEIVLNNGIRYLVVAGVGKLMMFIGRILIAVGTTLGFYCLITFVPSIKSNIMEPLYLLLIVFVIGFAVGALFIYIYSIAIDTILACFIVDQMNQSAKGGKAALYGPSELNELLPEHDQRKQ